MRYSRTLLLISMILLISCSTSKNIKQQNISLENWRKDYKASFIKNDRSPLTKDDLSYLDFYDEDTTWKLQCTCTPVFDAKPFEMPLYSGITRTYKVHSVLNCKRNDEDIQLQVYQNVSQPVNPIYADHLFLPFKDETNDEETYGGGRYIDLRTTDIVNNKVTIDFNRCYNPWCAFSDGYNCPIPPVENHLPMKVRAGEKQYKGKYKYKD